jgi:glycosyltransferase involved in cell wall biosynthesis
VNPSRFEGWSTTVEEAKAVGTPMLLSDIPVHREQAPHADFFGTDDAAAMADAIASASPRPLRAIRVANDEARKVTLQRQSDYAQTVSWAVRHAAKAGGMAREQLEGAA